MSSPFKKTQTWRFQPIQNVRLSDSAVEQISALIESDELSVGDKLPGERELMLQLGIGRASVREALRQLESQGFVAVRPGKGTFIVNSGPQKELLPALTEWFEQHDEEWLEVLEVRGELESLAVGLAARTAPIAKIEKLEAAVDSMSNFVEKGDLMAATHADREFHRLLYEASGNSFLALLGDSIVGSLFAPRYSILRVPGKAQQSIDEHRAILGAIRSRSPELGKEAIYQHISSVRVSLQQFLQLDSESVRTSHDQGELASVTAPVATGSFDFDTGD